MKKWDTATAVAGSAELTGLLSNGWEPIGLTTVIVEPEPGKLMPVLVFGLRRERSALVLPDSRPRPH